MNLIDDELSPEELAYQRSDVMTWRGRELEPFSYLRKTAAMSLLRHFNSNMPEPVVVLWLSLQDDQECKDARRNPERFEDEIDEWAQNERLLNGVVPADDVQQVYDTIMADIAASMSRPADKDTEAEKKRLGTEPASQATT